MEEVLELVELAERQKSADEREIESLRRALQRIHQPRGHKDTRRNAARLESLNHPRQAMVHVENVAGAE